MCRSDRGNRRSATVPAPPKTLSEQAKRQITAQDPFAEPTVLASVTLVTQEPRSRRSHSGVPVGAQAAAVELKVTCATLVGGEQSAQPVRPIGLR